MIVLQIILGLIIIIVGILGFLLFIAVLFWLMSILDNKLKNTVVEKIINFIIKAISILFWTSIFGLLILVIVGMAFNIGSSIL